MKRTQLMLSALVASAGFQPQAKAQAAIDIGPASSFAILASSTVTNAGFTTVTGDLGLCPGTSVTGFETVDDGPGIVNGTIDVADLAAMQAQAGATVAYITAAADPATVSGVTAFTNGDILTPGVYNASSTLLLSGDITLSGAGDYIFQIGSGLTAASGTVITLTGGAQSCDIIWQVGSSATLGTSSTFQGIIIAEDSITVNTGATEDGGLFALTAAVTLDDNYVIAAVPEPADTPLLIAGFAALVVGARMIGRATPMGKSI